MEREVVGSSARSSVNDKLFGPASATRGTTSELRSGKHFDTDTVSNPSDSSKQKARFWFYEPVHPEADTTGVNSRENVSQKLTSTEQDKEEFFVSHKWDKAIEPKPKRSAKPRKVTNVGSLGQVYNVTGEDESSSADEKIHSTGRKRQLNSKQKTASTDSATEEEVPTSFEEASKLRVWRDSMKTEV